MKSCFSLLAARTATCRSSYPRWLRLSALLTAGTFGWTLILAAPAEALAHQLPQKQEDVRKLTPQEMQKILGATNPQIALGHTGTVVGTDLGQYLVTPYWTISLGGTGIDFFHTINQSTHGGTGSNGWTVIWASGTANVTVPTTATVATNYSLDWTTGSADTPTHEEYSHNFDVVSPSTLETTGEAQRWQANVNGVNLVNGNKTTAIPIVSWKCKGGMSVDLSLVHNSYSTKNDVLGQKWTHSYDVYGSVDGSGNVTLHFGDDRSQTWTKSGSVFIPPTGIFDALVKNVDSTYTLTFTNQIKYNFTTGLQLSTIVDTNSNTITLGYTSGVLTSITDPTSRAITLSYTSGKLTGISDPLSRSWTLSYTSGDLTGIQLPVVHSNTYSYTLGYTSHNITTLTKPRGYSWTASYNSDNSIAWEKDPYSNEVSYGYNAPSGGVYTRTVTDSNSHVTTYTFDTNNCLTQTKDPLNDHEDYLYDANWCRKQITDKRGKVWQFTFDGSGNTLTAENPLLNTWTNTYTSHNRLQSAQIPTGEETYYSYDTHDRLTGVAWKDHSGVTQASTSYTVNSSGQTTDYYDANTHHYLYGYDSNGYRNSTTTPLSNVTNWTFNALGFCTSREDARLRTTNYTPDGWERLVTITYPDSSTKTYSFDADNNLTGWTDSLGTWIRRYDNADRMTQEILSATQTVAYAYDATGKKGLLSSVSDLYNTRTVTYSYTTRNELYSVAETAGTTTYGYDANGNETSISNPNGTTVTEGYDDDSFQTSVVNKNSSSTVLSSFTYAPDTDNRKHTCTESDGSVTTYGYDYASRLTSDVRTGTNPYSTSYTLDGNGSRTSQTIGTATTAFTLDDDDELTATSSSTGGFVNSYGYNANGEQTSRTLSGVAYTSAYDYDSQLTSITQGSTVVSYVYDGLGRRWSRTSAGTTTKFLYDGNNLITQFVGATITSNYTYGNALIRKDGETPLFDGLGSERTVTNSSQTVTGTINYDSFGNTVGTTGSSTNPYMFGATSGYRNDNDAGLTLVGVRYYDAQVGRFITRDTLLDQQPYLYCEHDPVNYVDPSGHDKIAAWFTEAWLKALDGINSGHPPIQFPPDPGIPLPPGFPGKLYPGNPPTIQFPIGGGGHGYGRFPLGGDIGKGTSFGGDWGGIGHTGDWHMGGGFSFGPTGPIAWHIGIGYSSPF